MSTTTALLILDMVSEFRFPDWRPVLSAATRIAPAVERLAHRARSASVPVVYVNDAGEKWESDSGDYVRRCSADGARGAQVARVIRPAPGDYFLFKPKHSGFYATPLPELLARLEVNRLILTGVTSHQCVLFTAMDAYVRDYEVVAPADCLGAGSTRQTRHALFILEESLNARIAPSRAVRFRRSSRPHR